MFPVEVSLDVSLAALKQIVTDLGLFVNAELRDQESDRNVTLPLEEVRLQVNVYLVVRGLPLEPEMKFISCTSLQRLKVAANKNAHNFGHQFWAQFFMLFHMV